MTRKKWNSLRRQRPELFKPFDGVSWEEASKNKQLLKMTRTEVIVMLTQAILAGPETPEPIWGKEKRARIKKLYNAQKPYTPEELQNNC